MQQPFIPYFQTSRYKVDTMVDLANPRSDENGIDLGSGDGRIVVAFAKKGVRMHGYEVNKDLILLSEKNIAAANLTNAFIENKNFWDVDLSGFNIITIYPMPDIMHSLEVKLENEARPGARVLTNFYPLPTWTPKRTKDNIYLYVR